MIAYYKVEKSPWKKDTWFITTTVELMELIKPLKKGEQYFYTMFWFGLFGLRPLDFFNYMKYNYKAVISCSNYKTIKSFYFLKEENAKNFCKELNKRVDYCVKHGYFD